MHEWRPRLMALGILVLAAATGSLTVNRDSPLSIETPITSYSPPRTPWGDPDLQGAFSNSDERGIPMNRPDAYAGMRIQDFSHTELARLNRERSSPARRPPGPSDPDYERTEINNSRPWLVSDPPEGQVPPTKTERRQQFADTTGSERRPTRPWESVDLATRCVTRGVPGSMIPTSYGNYYEIFQAPGVVVITYEAMHEARVIWLDERPALDSAIRSYVGDARGRFEGDSLVVETTNFTNKTPFHLSSEHLRLVERFSPIGPGLLEWSVTLDDPTTWARPWTFGMNLTGTTSRPLEFACHEGNYSMRNMLAVVGASAGEWQAQR